MSEWQPIETAPKDGEVVLIARRFDADPDFEGVPGGVVCAGYWEEGYGDGPDYMGMDDGWHDLRFSEFLPGRSFGNPDYRHEGSQPTHWMPLPPPPEPEAEAEAE